MKTKNQSINQNAKALNWLEKELRSWLLKYNEDTSITTVKHRQLGRVLQRLNGDAHITFEELYQMIREIFPKSKLGWFRPLKGDRMFKQLDAMFAKAERKAKGGWLSW